MTRTILLVRSVSRRRSAINIIWSALSRGTGTGTVFFSVDETLITDKSMFLFPHRYAEEYLLRCGLAAAAIVRQLRAPSKASQPRETINRYYYSLSRREPYIWIRAAAEAPYREGGYGFHREVAATLR